MSHALARLRAHFGDPLLIAKGRELQVSKLTRVPFFSLAARIVAEHDHVLTMTELFARGLVEHAALRVVRCPVQLAPLTFSQIWHRRFDDDATHVWLRAAVSRVCRQRTAGA